MMAARVYHDGMRHVALIVLVLAAPLAAYALGGSEPSYEDPAQLSKLIAGNTPYILVDVRTPEEFASGHLPTAVNIPVATIGATPPTPEKDALIVVYCRSGARSTAAKKTLDDLGYTHVVNFGSVSRWTGELVSGS